MSSKTQKTLDQITEDMKKYEQYRSELHTSLSKVIQEIYLLEEEKKRLLRQMEHNNNLIVEKQVEGDKILRDTKSSI